MTQLNELEVYPWHRHKPGESFFIPCLDTKETIVQGLRVGRWHLGLNSRLQARAGVFRGLLGVMFTVRSGRSPPDTAR